MRRLMIGLLAVTLVLTSCAYIGATEDILIAAPSTQSTAESQTAASDGSASPLPDTTADPNGADAGDRTVILNKNSKKIHYYDTCSYAGNIKEENKSVVPYEQCASLLSEGYTVCSWCEKQSEKS